MQSFGPQGKEDQEYAIFLGARGGGSKLCSLLRARGREAKKLCKTALNFVWMMQTVPYCSHILQKLH